MEKRLETFLQRITYIVHAMIMVAQEILSDEWVDRSMRIAFYTWLGPGDQKKLIEQVLLSVPKSTRIIIEKSNFTHQDLWNLPR